MTPRHLSRQEVANRFGCHVNTVDRWHLTGVGPKRFAVGRIVRYDERDVEAWAAQNAQ